MSNTDQPTEASNFQPQKLGGGAHTSVNSLPTRLTRPRRAARDRRARASPRRGSKCERIVRFGRVHPAGRFLVTEA